MTIEPPPLAFLEGRIAYRRREGRGPALLFLPGYASDMEGAKALALDAFAAERGRAFVRFDYSGTGSSAGAFEDGTLDRWLDDALAVIDRMTRGRLILIGSSMGGWLALHAALRRPQRVQAIVGIAVAPDFTDWGFLAGQKAELERSGRIERGGRATTLGFWRSGQAMRLLDGPIAVDCPVRLVHGEADEDVPLAVARRTLAALRSADVQLKVIKSGGHRLSQPHEIAAILSTVAELLEPQ